MSAENGQNFVNKSEFQCLSVDGATAMNLPLHGIVSDFNDISPLNFTESLVKSGHNDMLMTDLFTDQCSMCHCVRIEENNQEFPELEFPVDSSRVKEASFHGICAHSTRYDSCDETSNSSHCPCINCQSERESILHQKKEFHKIWTQVSEAIGRVFNAECAASVLSEPDFLVLKSHVSKLCQMNCHYLFKKLEKRCRQMVINMKIHILKRTTLQSTDTSDVAYNFMSIILRKYTHLCTACEILAEVLSPFVEQHMRQFNATWQLHNKYLFCCVIFNEPIVQKCLPDASEIIRHDLKRKHQETLTKEQESLMKKYTKVLLDHERLSKEMMNVSMFWKSCQQNIEKYDETYEMEKMKERKHCLIDGLEFIKKQRQLLKEIQGGCLLDADAFDNTKRVHSFEKLWILGRANETNCPNCRSVKCSYDEGGMSHLITCGIISPDIISEEGLLPPTFEKHEPDLQEYLNSASIRSTSSSSDDSFLADGFLHQERRRGDGGGVSSEDDDDEDDDDDEEEDDDDDDDDDFHDAQQIHMPDFCPSIENASSELVNRCNQSFLLQQTDVVPNCSCLKCNKESLCLFSYNKKNPKHFLKFMLNANQNGEEDDDDDDDDEDYDINEDGIHTASGLEYATMNPLTNAELLLKTSQFVDYPDETSFSSKSLIETFIDYSNQQPFSQKPMMENNFSQRFLLPTLEYSQEKCMRFCTNDRQLPPPSSPVSCTMPDENDALSSLEDRVKSSMSLKHCCSPKAQTTSNALGSPAKITEHKILKTPTLSLKLTDESSCEIKLQRIDTTGIKSSSDKKSGKDRSTQHPEKILSPGDKKPISTSCNYYQVALKHPNSCQKQQQQQQTCQQKPGSCDNGSVQSVHPQQKQGSFTIPQQPAKQQQPLRCRAPSCNGHMVGTGEGGEGGTDECDASPHPHVPSCESDDKSGSQKDLNGKSHCECWHCEFFGHETQSNAPTSKNFAECRDRLRQKLKKKQTSSKTSKNSMNLSRDSNSGSKSSSPDQISSLKSVDELIDFINGGKGESVDQISKERRKDSGIKKKSTKHKKTKDSTCKNISGPELSSENLIEDKKSDDCLQHCQPNSYPSSYVSSKSMQFDNNSKSSESDSRVHPTLISESVATSTSSKSLLENSVPMLKTNSPKKFEIPPIKVAIEKKGEPIDKVKKDSQKNGCSHKEEAIASPRLVRSTFECKVNSSNTNSKQTLNFELKLSLTPPSSPHSKSKKIDRKASEQNNKQKVSILKSPKIDPTQTKEIRENGSCSVVNHFKQTKTGPSSPCLLSGMISEALSKANRTCLSTKTATTENNNIEVLSNDVKNSSHTSTGSSSPPLSSRNKKQKKRNKLCSDLSIEEIFKPNDEEVLGEDDREIEEFKRFCFNTPPLPVREKLRVNLNVKDIFNRRKPPQSCNS